MAYNFLLTVILQQVEKMTVSNEITIGQIIQICLGLIGLIASSGVVTWAVKYREKRQDKRAKISNAIHERTEQRFEQLTIELKSIIQVVLFVDGNATLEMKSKMYAQYLSEAKKQLDHERMIREDERMKAELEDLG